MSSVTAICVLIDYKIWFSWRSNATYLSILDKVRRCPSTTIERDLLALNCIRPSKHIRCIVCLRACSCVCTNVCLVEFCVQQFRSRIITSFVIISLRKRHLRKPRVTTDIVPLACEDEGP